eukprot:11070845-Lingulodinium_polyedra.AAC.1
MNRRTHAPHLWRNAKDTHGARPPTVLQGGSGAMGGGAVAAPAAMAIVPYCVSAWWLCPVPSHHQLV